MIGAHPTAGCLAVFEKADVHVGLRRLRQALNPLIPEDGWRPLADTKMSARAALGNTHLQALLHSRETEAAVLMFIDFDEDAVVGVSRATGVSMEELLSPYVTAIKNIEEASAICLGFELSSPADFDEQSLRAAGVAIAYLRDHEGNTWIRKQLLPMVGHYL